MMRRGLFAFVLVPALIGAVAAVAASADVPAGPRLALARVGYSGRFPSPSFDLITAGPNRDAEQLVAGSSLLGSSPPAGAAWSPDGQTLAISIYKEAGGPGSPQE